MDWDGLPRKLRRHGAWLRWDSGSSFQPKAPRDKHNQICDATNPSNWFTFKEAKQFDDIGVVLSKDDPLVGIDLDKITKDEITSDTTWSELPKWVRPAVENLDTYCEVSPSGRGLRLFVLNDAGDVPTSQSTHQSIYSHGRFLTVTGNVFHDAPIRTVSKEILQKFFPETDLSQDIEDADVPAFEDQNRENHGQSVDDVYEQASSYLDACEESIQGYGGDEQMFKICSVLLFDFGLPIREVKQLAYWFGEYRARPSWSRRDINHKIKYCIERYKPQDDKKIGWRVESKVDLVEAFDIEEQPPTVGELPESVYDVPGFIGEFYQWMAETCHRNQREYHLGTAIATMSAICGSCCTDFKGNWPNLYCLLIGSSGTGKQHPNNAVRDLLSAIDDYPLFEMSPTSEAATFRCLEREKIRLWLWEEAGQALRHAGEHGKTLMSAMVRLFNGRACSKDYSDDRKSFHVHDCHLAILGSTIPQNFFGALTEENLVDGFMSRWLIFREIEDANLVDSRRGTVPRSLRKTVNLWRNERLSGKDPIEVDLVGHPKTYFTTISEDAEMKRRRTDSEARKAIYARIAEMVLKVALCYEMSSQGIDAKYYTIEGIKWAETLVMHSMNSTLSHIEHYVSNDEFSDKQNQILRFLKDKGRVTKGKLYNRFWRWPVKDRDALMRSLVPTKIEEDRNGRTTHYELRTR